MQEHLEDVANQLFDIGFGELRNEPWFLSSTLERQQAVVAAGRERAKVQAVKLLTAIETKDAKHLLATLHLGNKVSRAIFMKLTGVTLGKTETETRKSIREFIGPANFDEYIDAIDRARAANEQQAADNHAANERRNKLSAAVQYKIGTDANFRHGTRQTFIDDLVANGFKPVEAKRGFRNVLKMVNDREVFTLQTKYEREYALERLAAISQPEGVTQ